MRGAGREFAGQRAHAVTAVGQQRDRRAPRQVLGLQNRAKPPAGLLILAVDQAEIPVLTTRGQGLADHDLEVAFLVMPVADVAAINADDDRALPELSRPTRGGSGEHAEAWGGDQAAAGIGSSLSLTARAGYHL